MIVGRGRGLWLFMGSLAALMVLNAAVSRTNLAQLQEDSGWVSHTYEVRDALAELRAQVHQTLGDQRTFLLTGDVQRHLAFLASVQESFRKAEVVCKLTKDHAGHQTNIEAILRQIEVTTTILANTAELRHQQGFEAALAEMKMGKSEEALLELDHLIDVMDVEERKLLLARQQTTDRAYAFAVTSGTIAALCGLGTVGVFAWLLRRYLFVRDRAAAERFRQQELLRMTLISIGDAVIVTDTDAKVTFLNSVAKDLTGWKDEEVRGEQLDTIFRIVNETTRKSVENPASRALKQGVIVGLANHTILISKDGTERPIDDSAAPIRDENGQLIGAVLVFRDISQSRELARSLEQSERRYRSLTEASSSVVWSTDGEGSIVADNPSWQAFTGQSPEQYRGWGWLNAIHPADRDHTTTVWRKALVSRSFYQTEYRLLREDGEHRYIVAKGVPVFGQRGELTEWIGTCTDIDDQKTALADLRKSEERTRTILESITDAFFTVDRDWRFTYVNRRALTYLDLPLPEVLDQKIWDVLAVARGSIFQREYERAVRDRVTAEFVAESTFSGRWLEVRAYPSAEGLSVYFRDITDRRNAENELRDIRSRMEAALAAGAIGTWSWDVRTDRFTGDESFARIFGISRTEVSGGPISGIMDAIHPDDRESIADLVNRTMLVGRHYEADYRVRQPDGSWRWVNARGQVERDENRQAIRFPGVVIDITDRKRAEEALARLRAESESQKRVYETILSNTPDFMYVFDLDHHFTYVNNALLEMWGKTFAESVGKTCLELGYEPWHAEMHNREIDQVAATKQPIRGEVPFNGTHGRRIYDYIFVPVIGEDGSVEAVAGTTRDVTDRQRSELELRKQTERLRLLWESAAVLLTTEEPDSMLRGLFARISPHFELDAYFNFMLAPTGDELRLKSFHGIPEEVAQTIATLDPSQVPDDQKVKEFGIRAYVRQPLIAEDRLIGTLSFASRSREKFDEDELEFLRTINHYVTVAYERLRLVEELQDADRRKDDFIALLAHELRNPLAPLRNGLQVLRLAQGNAELIAESRGMMERQLGHMVRLIDDLLDVSRISRNKLTLRLSRVTLAEVVNSALETSRPPIDAAEHHLEVSLPTEPIWLNADLTRLAQVFSNILINSAKYTERGGKIWLTATVADEIVTVAVRDTGIGIPPESLPTIFNMFSQVNRSIERTTGGLGIGLALVHGLVEMHSGMVTVESPGLGAGTTFTVQLRALGQDADATSAGSHQETVPVPTAYRMLVVDDNRDSAVSMATMLRLLGNEVRKAHDGIEAIEVADEFRPQIILMDVGMPRLNGYDATRRIRERSWGSSITIIALTGWGQQDDRAKSSSAGCNGHLVKPVHLPDLQQLLAQVRSSEVPL